jgi:hypothetical protein
VCVRERENTCKKREGERLAGAGGREGKPQKSHFHCKGRRLERENRWKKTDKRKRKKKNRIRVEKLSPLAFFGHKTYCYQYLFYFTYNRLNN